MLPDLKFTPVFKSLMKTRGLSSSGDVIDFLSPHLGQLRDPSVMKDMELACRRILSAIDRREKIGVFTDYDVDGVCSAVLIQRFLVQIGCEPPAVFIPDRVSDGYGLNIRGIDELHRQGVRLLITADCGVTAVKEVEHARSLGMDVIITDHHELGTMVPDAHCILNPKQSDCPFFGEDLCGAGVVFHLIIALRAMMRLRGIEPLPNLKAELDLVAMATIADAVPLSRINRILVKEGLNILNASGRTGLAALTKAAGLNREVFSRDIGYILGPRINAAGRLSDARKAFDLLMTDDEAVAQGLARELNELNRSRQATEQQVLAEALSCLEGGREPGNVVIAAGTNWHTGVIGIVASRLAAIFSRPAIVISLQDGAGTGSGRSVPGVDLHASLAKVSDHLNDFGGHKMAVGMSIDEQRIPSFSSALNSVVGARKKGVESFEVDLKVSPLDITPVLLEELEMLSPFGEGNPEPVFMIPSMEIVSARTYARGQCKLVLKHSNRIFHSLRFALDHSSAQLTRYVDVAFTPVRMRANGYQYLYLALKAISPAGKSDEPAPFES